MVILGGSGNNLGTIFGALLVYIIWTMSEPAALFLFEQGAYWTDRLFGLEAPDDLATRALQMRVFVIGLAITLVLRFAPKGLLPEKEVRYDYSGLAALRLVPQSPVHYLRRWARHGSDRWRI